MSYFSLENKFRNTDVQSLQMNILHILNIFKHFVTKHSMSPGPSCSKHSKPNKLINNKLVKFCSYDIFKYVVIFACKNVSSFCNHNIFSAKTINVFAIFQDRNFNITSA